MDFAGRAGALAALVVILSAAPAPALSLSAVADEESRAAFGFFWEQANSTPGSPGFGLIRDRWPGNPGVASIASVGFGLSAIAVGVERGWVTCTAYALYERVDWPWFVDAAKNQFWMAWRPGTGFEGHWDSYAGQLILLP